jgi:hypothetical protein
VEEDGVADVDEEVDDTIDVEDEGVAEVVAVCVDAVWLKWDLK